LTVSSVTTVFKHIRKKSTSEKRRVLKSIENKPSREVKRLFAEPAKPIQIKKTEYRDRVHLRLELSHEQNEKIQKLKALKSHCGNLETLLENLIDSELKKYANSNFQPTRSKNRRFISKRLRNSVLKGASFRCEHPGCEETHFLQIDHIRPIRQGGTSTRDNLQVLCGAHNRWKG